MNENEITMIYGTMCRYKDGRYFVIGGFGRLVDEIARKYSRVYLMLPVMHVKSDDTFSEYCIKSDNVIVQEIPFYKNYVDAMKMSKKIKKCIQEYSACWNGAVYIRWMTIFFDYVKSCAQKRGLPVVFHLVDDPETIIKNGNKYKGIKRCLALAIAKRNSALIKKLLTVYPALVNGNDLRRLYSPDNTHIREIRTSTILKSEITYSHREMDKNNIKLLFVGRIREQKGLEYLLDAIADLQSKGYNISFTLVGDGEYKEQLIAHAETLGIVNKLTWTGRIGMGDGLFEEYKKADIFVLPSLSEGTPRTLIEAMCNGTAVVATDAGGITFTVTNRENGLTVPIKNSCALAKAIEEVIQNDDLRHKMADNGYFFAEKNTIESHAEEVYRFIMNQTKEKR